MGNEDDTETWLEFKRKTWWVFQKFPHFSTESLWFWDNAVAHDPVFLCCSYACLWQLQWCFFFPLDSQWGFIHRDGVLPYEGLTFSKSMMMRNSCNSCNSASTITLPMLSSEICSRVRLAVCSCDKGRCLDQYDCKGEWKSGFWYKFPSEKFKVSSWRPPAIKWPALELTRKIRMQSMFIR